MPELPDIAVYVESLQARLLGATLERLRLAHPFVLRTYTPDVESSYYREVQGISRLGKRIVISLSGDLHWVIHLMIAGRFRFLAKGAKIPGRIGLAAFDFSKGTLLLTEATSKRRASLHLVAGTLQLNGFKRDGVEPLEVTFDEFAASLRRENHTLKRALTDPNIVSGIGNSYSDEILHRAHLSPLLRTQALDDNHMTALFSSCQSTLSEWIDRLRAEAGQEFPENVTAFRAEMAVHGRFGEPCPTCGTKVQRIRYASNECNYCPTCQTHGRLLADRGLSRLLRGDWPRTLEELEEKLETQR